MSETHMKKKHYIVYRTINTVNGKYYTGCHETYDLDDGYLGSGVVISLAIKKYGRKAFKRVILGMYDSRELMIDAEIDLVDHKDPMSYNLIAGGTGYTIRPKSTLNKKVKPHRAKSKLHRFKSPTTEEERLLLGAHNIGRKHCAETRKKIGDTKRGKRRSPEVCARLSEVLRGRTPLPETVRKTRDTKEHQRNERFWDNLPDITGSFHFGYGRDPHIRNSKVLGSDFLTMDTSLKSHLDKNTTYAKPKPMTMKLACGTTT